MFEIVLLLLSVGVTEEVEAAGFFPSNDRIRLGAKRSPVTHQPRAQPLGIDLMKINILFRNAKILSIINLLFIVGCGDRLLFFSRCSFLCFRFCPS